LCPIIAGTQIFSGDDELSSRDDSAESDETLDASAGIVLGTGTDWWDNEDGDFDFGPEPTAEEFWDAGEMIGNLAASASKESKSTGTSVTPPYASPAQQTQYSQFPAGIYPSSAAARQQTQDTQRNPAFQVSSGSSYPQNTWMFPPRQFGPARWQAPPQNSNMMRYRPSGSSPLSVGGGMADVLRQALSEGSDPPPRQAASEQTPQQTTEQPTSEPAASPTINVLAMFGRDY
jgi:hypothetical protein